MTPAIIPLGTGGVRAADQPRFLLGDLLCCCSVVFSGSKEPDKARRSSISKTEVEAVGRREDIQEDRGPRTVEISGEAAIAGVGEKEEKGRTFNTGTFTTITIAIVSE